MAADAAIPTRPAEDHVSGERCGPDVEPRAVSSPPGADIIDKTREYWRCRTGLPVSGEDAREAARNIVAFVQLLSTWDADHCTQADGAATEEA